MFLNISNHPSNKWEQSQIDAAYEAGGFIRDIPFPSVPATATPELVKEIGDKIFAQVTSLCEKNPNENVAMIMGEFSLTLYLVHKLACYARPVVATTNRVKKELPDGSIVHYFKFIKFREYIWR